jgi:hypothetical protein
MIGLTYFAVLPFSRTEGLASRGTAFIQARVGQGVCRSASIGGIGTKPEDDMSQADHTFGLCLIGGRVGLVQNADGHEIAVAVDQPPPPITWRPNMLHQQLEGMIGRYEDESVKPPLRFLAKK